MSRLVWLADELEAAGLDVRGVPGWETRGRSVGFDPRCIIDHHTAGAVGRPNPSLNIVTHGRPGVPGPLCNILVGRDSVCWVIAAGISNNAGEGQWAPHDATRNSHTIGHEVEHAGRLELEPVNLDQLWTAAIVDSVICRRFGWTSDRCVAHKEWAPSRKIDPVWSQSAHRSRVAQLLSPPAAITQGVPVDLEQAVNIVRQAYLDARGNVPIRVDGGESYTFWVDKVQKEGFPAWAALIRGLATEGA